MTYIYDVLLNFIMEDRIIEFFEWEDSDTFEHIKRIPIYKVSTKKLNEILNNNIKIDKVILNDIKDKTLMYRKTKNLQYALLLSDTNRVIGLEFNHKGEVISRSGLLLDEEEEIIEESYDLKEIDLKYIIQSKLKKNHFLTRNEQMKRNYLLKEIENLYKEKNHDKLTYLYEEIYKQDDLSIDKKYSKLKIDLEDNYSNKHNQLYDIVRLTYTKK